MKILGLVGSPRKSGNTDIIIDEIIKGSRDANIETEKIYLNKLNIHPCDACNSCFKTGKCKYDDDFSSVTKIMEESDVWIIGTPVYWWGPTSFLKAFIDRWYAFDLKRNFFQGKQMILVIVSGGGDVSYSRHIIGMFEDITQYLGIKLKDRIICGGVSRKGDVLKNKEIIQNAYSIGSNLGNI